MNDLFTIHVVNVDSLAVVMMVLVGFISLIVANFATRYMRGDTRYRIFFVQLALLTCSVMLMACADHLVLLLCTWGISNFFIVRLMIHKACWPAARASGCLAAKTYLLGFLCIACSFALLYTITGQNSIQAIMDQDIQSILLTPALLLLLVGAMTQSAIWPFHHWLTSSLNSPTPVSAMLHAGLVNGGGFLLARFATLYFHAPTLLTIIFMIGMSTALLGTLWKLMQSDVKRMLACSTMGQMGFMLAQCGLGLFAAAVAHLIYHGMFKAYLFLASGSAAQEKRLALNYPPTLLAFACALLCGVVGSYGFAIASCKLWLAKDTTLVLKAVAFLAAAQFALTRFRVLSMSSIVLAIVETGVLGVIYGLNVHFIEFLLEPLHLNQPQPLNLFHVLGMLLLVGAWLSMLFFRNTQRPRLLLAWLTCLYVKALNASQPHPSTTNAYRNQYQYE
jgi:NAD(P)H-quinone oxidoreductase subunit 5